MVTEHVRRRPRQIQNADARVLRRTRLPRALHAESRIFYRDAAPECAVETGGLSRRGALDPETTEQPTLVQNIFRLARGVSGISGTATLRWASQTRTSREPE